MSVPRTGGSFEFFSIYQEAVTYLPLNGPLMSLLSLNALRWRVWASQCAGLSVGCCQPVLKLASA